MIAGCLEVLPRQGPWNEFIPLALDFRFSEELPMPKARAFEAAKYRDNPKMIANYLNHALVTGDAILITQAIGDMIRAQSVTRISQKVGLRRDSLYRSFRGHTGPRFETVIKAIVALNIQLVAKPSANLPRSR